MPSGQPRAEVPSGQPRAGLLLGLAYVGFIGLGFRSGLLGVAWPSIRADFDVPLDALGALLGPFSVGYLLGSFASGGALVRWNFGILLAASFGAMALNLIGSAVAPAWWVLLALGLPGGLGTGMIDAGMNTYVANRHGARHMNWLHACWGIGVTLSPLAMTVAITSGPGWRWGYAVTGCLVLALAAGYLATRRMWPSRGAITQHDPDSGARPTASMFQTLRLPVAWLSILLFIVYTGVELGIGQWAFPLLVDARGVAAVEAGAAVSVYWAGLTLGRIFFGVVVAAIGVERLLWLCMLGILIGLGVLWLPTAPVVAVVALAVLGALQAPVFPALIAITPERFGAVHTANAVGFQVAASVIGGAGLPALMGWLARGFGLQVIVPSLVVAAVLQIVCWVAWSRNQHG